MYPSLPSSHISLATGWKFFVERLTKATCAAELRRIMDKGPPINVRDKAAFPCENDSEEVYEFWYMSDGEVHSAKLFGIFDHIV